MPSNTEHLHGTLELLVLKILEDGSMNGYAIGKRIQEVTEDELRIEEGSLYPALYRMQRRGWLKGEWGTSENNRKAKFYRLSRSGRKRLEKGTAAWGSFADAVGKILGSA